MGSVVVVLFGGGTGGGVNDDGRSEKSRESKGVSGDMDPVCNQDFCTGVFGSASGSRLNGSSFCEPEVEAITNAGRG